MVGQKHPKQSQSLRRVSRKRQDPRTYQNTTHGANDSTVISICYCKYVIGCCSVGVGGGGVGVGGTGGVGVGGCRVVAAWAHILNFSFTLIIIIISSSSM
jgi:hypothetical protein